MADNFHFDITGAPLLECLNIAWIGSPGGKATHWFAEETEVMVPCLILAWHEDKNMIPFPAPMTASECEPFIKAWLDSVDYSSQPDHDGDNTKGWRVYNELWARVRGYSYVFVAIEPAWLMYGK